MVNTAKLKALARKKGMAMTLTDKGAQRTGGGEKPSGTIWDFDVSGGDVSRVVVAKNRLGMSANVFSGQSSKNGIDFKSENQLVDFMASLN